MSDSLFHYGIKRRSGRYPWGSGDDPYQSESAAFRKSKTTDRFEAKRQKKLAKNAEKAEKTGEVKLRNGKKVAKSELENLDFDDLYYLRYNTSQISDDEYGQLLKKKLSSSLEERGISKYMNSKGKVKVDQIPLSKFDYDELYLAGLIGKEDYDKLRTKVNNPEDFQRIYGKAKHSDEGYSDSLFHYGIKRRSGRYPWGSGDDPYQSEPSSYASRMKAKQIGTKASGPSKKNTDDVIEGEYKEHKSGKKKNKKKGSSDNGENNNVNEETYAEAQEARKASKDKKNKESKSKDSDNQSNDQSNNDSKNNKKKNKEKTTGETINKYGQDTIKGLKSLNTNARQTYRLATTEDLSGYTDDQLRALINRMNLENQYYNSKAHSTTKSQEVVNKLLDTTGSALKIGTSVYDLSNFIDEKAKRAKKILY